MTPEPEPPRNGARPRPRVLGRFLAAEVRGLVRAFVGPFWKTTAVVAAALLLLLLVLVFRAGPPPPRAGQPGNDPPLPVKLAVLVGFSLFYGGWVGLFAGMVGLLWRLV